MAVIEITTGPSGSGKSLIRCGKFGSERFFIDGGPEVRWVTNFPINVELMAAAVAKNSGGRLTAEDVASRIELIPEAELKEWADGASGRGPWDYFAGQSLDGVHVAIDECHVVCGCFHRPRVRQRWQKWIADIRHGGGTVEFLTQSEEKVARELFSEAGVKRILTPNEDRRDPFFRIRIRDWYELRAGFLSRRYTQATLVQEQRRKNRKWVTEHSEIVVLDPCYFPLYNSFSAMAEGGQASAGKVYEFERRTRAGLAWWFFSRNWYELTWRSLLVCVAVWLVCFGGLNWSILHFMGSVDAAVKRGGGAAVAGEAGKSSLRSAAKGVSEAPGPVDAVGGSGGVVPGGNPGGESVGQSGRVGGPVPVTGDEKRARADLEAARRLKEEAKRAEEDAKGRIERCSEIVGLTGRGVWTGDGDFLQVGEKFADGSLKGEVIKSIDLAGRVCFLESGKSVRFRMRVPGRRRTKEEAASDAGPISGVDKGGDYRDPEPGYAGSFPSGAGGGPGFGGPGVGPGFGGVGGGGGYPVGPGGNGGIGPGAAASGLGMPGPARGGGYSPTGAGVFPGP